MPTTPPTISYDLLDPALLPQDQGWRVVNEQGAEANFNPTRPVQATANGTFVAVSSIGLPPDIPTVATSALQWFHRPIDVAVHRPFSVDVTLRVDALTGPSNSFDGAAVLYASTVDPDGFLFTGAPRAQMVVFDADRISWGDDSQSFAIDTTDGFHDYSVDVMPSGRAEVYADGALALWRDDFQPIGHVGFGDMTNDAGLDGAISVADFAVSGVPAEAAMRTTYYFTGTVINASDPRFEDLVIAGFFGLLPGDAVTYGLTLEDALLQPNVPVSLAVDDPAYQWDILFNGTQIGNNTVRGPALTPNGDLSSLAGVIGGAFVDPFDGPAVLVRDNTFSITTDDDVGARIPGIWVANQPGLPAATPVDGTGSDDILGGSGADDFLRGFAGDDQLRGFDGADVIDGGDGDDNLYGKDGDDRLFGQTGADSMRGSDGEDLLFGGDGNDFMRGGADADRLYGEDGDDRAEGDGGDDILDGGTGNDSLRGETGNDTLLGGEGDDSLKGGSGADVLNGANGRDILVGNDGGDLLNGGDGEDTLDGGSGDDILFGAAGFDILDGGPGNDSFIFAFRDDVDEIHGFTPGACSDDVIDLRDHSLAVRSFDFLLANASYDGFSTEISFNPLFFDGVVLVGVAPQDLHADDFLFRV